MRLLRYLPCAQESLTSRSTWALSCFQVFYSSIYHHLNVKRITRRLTISAFCKSHSVILARFFYSFLPLLHVKSTEHSSFLLFIPPFCITHSPHGCQVGGDWGFSLPRSSRLPYIAIILSHFLVASLAPVSLLQHVSYPSPKPFWGGVREKGKRLRGERNDMKLKDAELGRCSMQVFGLTSSIRSFTSMRWTFSSMPQPYHTSPEPWHRERERRKKTYGERVFYIPFWDHCWIVEGRGGGYNGDFWAHDHFFPLSLSPSSPPLMVYLGTANDVLCQHFQK